MPSVLNVILRFSMKSKHVLGKTNIAMLAILNTIHEHTFKSQILKDEFKVIFNFCYSS